MPDQPSISYIYIGKEQRESKKRKEGRPRITKSGSSEALC